jgi:hypothetical protein
MMLVEHQRTAAEALDRIVADHGVWRVLAAVLRRAMRRRAPAAVLMPDLPAHLRRDLGLPDLPPPAAAVPPQFLVQPLLR